MNDDHPDVKFVRRKEGRATLGIDDVREMRMDAYLSATESEHRIYIFENAAVYKYTSFFIPGFFLAVGSVIKLYQGFTSSDIIKFSYYFRTIDFYIKLCYYYEHTKL